MNRDDRDLEQAAFHESFRSSGSDGSLNSGESRGDVLIAVEEFLGSTRAHTHNVVCRFIRAETFKHGACCMPGSTEPLVSAHFTASYRNNDAKPSLSTFCVSDFHQKSNLGFVYRVCLSIAPPPRSRNLIFFY